MKGWREFFLFYLLFIVSTAQGGIKGSKHDLSATGPGPIKATDTTRICKFCHTPHGASPAVPLWNRDITYQQGVVYRTYTSPTLDALPGQPTGATKLCLSCHDGTVAVGQLLRERVRMTDSGTGRLTPEGRLSPSSPGYIGTDLSGSHPVSFKVTQLIISTNNAKGNVPLRSVREMKIDPDGVRLDRNNEVQCTSCHDPHDDSNRTVSGLPFWRKKDFASVCMVCHAL